jgi:hypothetical protein
MGIGGVFSFGAPSAAEMSADAGISAPEARHFPGSDLLFSLDYKF